jgi:hypothetical protein
LPPATNREPRISALIERRSRHHVILRPEAEESQ